MSIIALHTSTVARGLTKWEASAIEKAAEEVGGWIAITFRRRCGAAIVAVTPTCEGPGGLRFTIARVDRKILLTTTWLDGKDYISEHLSVPGALRALRATLSKTAEASAA